MKRGEVVFEEEVVSFKIRNHLQREGERREEGRGRERGEGREQRGREGERRERIKRDKKLTSQ